MELATVLIMLEKLWDFKNSQAGKEATQILHMHEKM